MRNAPSGLGGSAGSGRKPALPKRMAARGIFRAFRRRERFCRLKAGKANVRRTPFLRDNSPVTAGQADKDRHAGASFHPTGTVIRRCYWDWRGNQPFRGGRHVFRARRTVTNGRPAWGGLFQTPSRQPWEGNAGDDVGLRGTNAAGFPVLRFPVMSRTVSGKREAGASAFFKSRPDKRRSADAWGRGQANEAVGLTEQRTSHPFCRC